MNHLNQFLILCISLSASTIVRGDYWERIRALESWKRGLISSDDEDAAYRSERHVRSIEGSGWDYVNSDDEDEDTGSGYMSACQKLRNSLRGTGFIGSYIPRCTDHGDFEVLQCHSNTGQCWCVNFDGQEIPGTMQHSPARPDCSRVDRSEPHPRTPPPTPKPRPGSNSKPSSRGDIYNVPDPDSYDSTGFGFENPRDNEEIKKTEPEITNLEDLEDDRSGMVGSGPSRNSIISQPGILAGIIGGAVVGLLCTTLLMMFVVYRMRKKDEGSYALDDPKQKSRDREFFA